MKLKVHEEFVNEFANAAMSDDPVAHSMSEVFALLALALPKANVSKLYRETTDDTQNEDINVSHVFSHKVNINRAPHSQ